MESWFESDADSPETGFHLCRSQVRLVENCGIVDWRALIDRSASRQKQAEPLANACRESRMLMIACRTERTQLMKLGSCLLRRAISRITSRCRRTIGACGSWLIAG
jgi:hypothetical protein